MRAWPAYAGAECPLCGDFLGTRPPGHAAAACPGCACAPPFFRSRSLFPYEGPAGEAIRAMKYRGYPVPAAALAERLHEALADRWPECLPPGGEGAIVPIPLSPWKYFRRGFNLPALVGAELARRTGLPCLPRLLFRDGPDRPQARLPLRDRRENARGAFRAGRKESGIPRAVLLLDDVRTSGATADAAASALREAGVARIVAVTLARAAPPSGRPEAGN